MSNDNTRDGAEPSPASDGSQPVGWGAVASDGSVVCMMRRRADVASYVVDGTPIVPLYRQPPLTLTDAEREAIEWSILQAEATIGMANEQGTIDGAAKTIEALRGLLERLK